MKKLFAIIIAVALLSTLCMQSFAAETDNDQRFTERQRNVLLALTSLDKGTQPFVVCDG